MSAVKDIEFTQIAADWHSITLGEEEPQALLAIRNGLTTKQSQDKGDYKVSRIETIGGGWIDETRVRFASGLKEKDVEKYRIQKGDILFSHINSDPHLGKTGFAERDYEDLLHGMNLLLIRANPEVFNAEFLNYIFQYYRDIGVFISICSRSVNQSSINQAKLKAVEVPLLPLPEQKKIAHILSTVQRAIEAQERTIQTTTELFKSMLHQLMTAQIRVSSGDRIAGDYEEYRGMIDGNPYPIPDAWAESSIGEATLKTKQRDPRKTPSEVFQYVDVSSISNESFKITRSTPTLGSDAPSRARNELNTADVLFATVRPTLKRIAVVPEELDGQIASTGYCTLRSDQSKVHPLFLYSFLITNHFNARMAGLERGANYPAVRDSDVKKSWLPLPPLPEQNKVAHILSTIQQKVDNARSKKSKLKDLFRTLLHELMTAKIRASAVEVGQPPRKG